MIDLAAALKRVVDALERADVPYLLVGSTAAAAWGVVRMTRDVDLVALITGDQIDAVLCSFNVIHPATGGKVDVFVTGQDDAFTRSRLSRRVEATVFDVSTWVAAAEDVVLAKLRWRLQSRSETQWRDCVEIAGIQELDRTYLQRWAPSLGVEADLHELFEVIEEI